MTCRSCGQDNRIGRRFCAQCGAQLTLICAACRAENEPGENFCGGCGTSLAQVTGAGCRVVGKIGDDLRMDYTALRRLVRPEIQTEPAVTLVEDLHWIDGGSEAFLGQWVEAIDGTRGLLLLNFRPEYHAGWMQKSDYRQIPLTPLGSEAVRSLLEDLLGHDASLRGLADAIHTRTAGNAVFTEEVVAACERELREAHRLFVEMGATGHAERISRQLTARAVPATEPNRRKPPSPAHRLSAGEGWGEGTRFQLATAARQKSTLTLPSAMRKRRAGEDSVRLAPSKSLRGAHTLEPSSSAVSTHPEEQ